MRNPSVVRTVYFIKPCGMDGPIKIGCSASPEDRLVCLAIWSPWPLEVVASASGTYADEQFLHSCFASSHSHREWFHSTPLLREIIAKIASGTTMVEVRGLLTPVGSIKKNNRKPVPEYRKELRSYTHRIRWAKTKSRKENTNGAWFEPDDVAAIMIRWEGRRYYGIEGKAPTPAEKARLEEYLSNPLVHSVAYVRDLKVAA